MVYDPGQQRLRLKITGEYTRYPRLCRKLFQDILDKRTIRLQDWVWPHILEAQPNVSSEWSIHALSSQVVTSPRWKTFLPAQFRKNEQSTIPVRHSFTKSIVKKFWSCTMVPQGRTIFYRSISGCIPTKIILLKYGIVDSSLCSFCSQADDSIRHFLVDCPPKWRVWSQILDHFYPSGSLSPELLYGSLRYLHVPGSVRETDKYFTILSTILWKLWTQYWSHGVDNRIPFSFTTSSQSFVPQIISLIDSLLHPYHIKSV